MSLSTWYGELEDVVTRIRSENANVPTRISVNFYRDEGDEYVVREYPVHHRPRGGGNGDIRADR